MKVKSKRFELCTACNDTNNTVPHAFLLNEDETPICVLPIVSRSIAREMITLFGDSWPKKVREKLKADIEALSLLEDRPEIIAHTDLIDLIACYQRFLEGSNEPLILNLFNMT